MGDAFDLTFPVTFLGNRAPEVETTSLTQTGTRTTTVSQTGTTTTTLAYDE